MMKRYLCLALLLLAAACAACTAEPVSSGTLTPISDGGMPDAYAETIALPNGSSVVSAVSAEQVRDGNATGWQYLLEEDMAPRVELQIYENGAPQATVTVLPGSAGLNGTILFGASASGDGYVWATDLKDSTGVQSHRYTYKTESVSEPRRLAASTTDIVPGADIWLAALLYDIEEGYAPTDIAALQEEGLDQVPLAAVLKLRFSGGDGQA